MEGGVEGGAEGGEESGADRGGVVREVGAYFACRGIDDLPPPWHGPPAQTPSGQVDVGEPVLVRNSPLGFDEAVGALEDWRAATQGERAGDESADGARDSVLVVDSLRELLSVVDGEASAVGANPKLLPKGLKWCAKHLDVLHALLLPPRPPRVRYGVDGLSYAPDGTPVRPDGWARRLGLRRLLIVQIIERLVGAKRPPLTAAIAEAAPSLLVDAAALLVRHPSSGVLATAVVRLLRAALLAKPLRLALVATGATTSGATTSGTTTAGAMRTGGAPRPSLCALLADVLLADERSQPPLASRAYWLEVAGALHAASEGDKQLRGLLAAESSWTRLSAALPELRAAALPDRPSAAWKCGPPPARATGHMGGEMGELLKLLAAMPSPTSG